jgi:probable DNA metabolism protein
LTLQLEDKLSILADAAKYDVSCASSGSRRKNNTRQLGNTAPSGICHSYTEDGRCVSLLKILYTNFCIYDCAYCINRCSNDVPRAAFTSAEVVALTIDFYRRNYIEGLFLSSGVLQSPDDTMERLVRTVQLLRGQGFNGYIHLKCVPFASKYLIEQAGLCADRLSVNIELPSEKSLQLLTRDKTFDSVLKPMGVIRETIAETRENRIRLRHTPRFAPAGQSTQLIVGASPESDLDILGLANNLYQHQALKRVYYSAYVPIIGADSRLSGLAQPPLARENRLYQADWLIRLYGFELNDLIDSEAPHLDLKIDPKLAFARRHPELFPIDVNSADREMILKVPGIGLKSANRIVRLRRRGRIRFEHLKQMGVVLSRAKPFIRCDGMPVSQWTPESAPRFSAKRQTLRIPDSPATDARLVFVVEDSFDGLLTAIFEVYDANRQPDAIASSGRMQPGLFERRVKIATDPVKAERVWKGLRRHLGGKRRRMLFEAYLSVDPGVETAILRYVWGALPARGRRRRKVALDSQLQVEKLSQQVRREAHRLKGFIRFQKTGDDQYLALVAPRYDVLPLIRRHFESRFADQKWIIYDTSRNYGIRFNCDQTQEIRLDAGELNAFRHAKMAEEQLCQSLWQQYFAAVNIAERDNPKLHLRQLPRRFWRYLPEKQG